MELAKQYEKIHLEVLKRVKPQKEEYRRLTTTFEELSKKIQIALTKEKITARIELTGSFSRDTWLAGTRDIDIFVILPYKSKIKPQQVLTAIKKEIKLDWVKKHAKHPYLFSFYNGIQIEIIPCYEFEADRELRSPVDRTPAHKQFLKDNMPVGINEEVRLLKRFLRGIDVYGAEIKVHGFSGYLVELLILHYQNSFLEVLRNASKLKEEIITFKDDLNVTKETFKDDVVIVVDPTDDNRNVASPVNERSLNTFIAAANRYLQKPSLVYFFPRKPVLTEKKKKELENHPLNYAGIILENPKISADILWGQIRKFETSLESELGAIGFTIVNLDSIVTEEEIIITIITIEKSTPDIYWHDGPPITNKKEEQFLRKYQNNPAVISGPKIIDGRWTVLLQKQSQRLDAYIKQLLRTNSIAKPSHLYLEKSTILFKKEFLSFCKKNEELLIYFAKLMAGKPPYMC